MGVGEVKIKACYEPQDTNYVLTVHTTRTPLQAARPLVHDRKSRLLVVKIKQLTLVGKKSYNWLWFPMGHKHQPPGQKSLMLSTTPAAILMWTSLLLILHFGFGPPPRMKKKNEKRHGAEHPKATVAVKHTIFIHMVSWHVSFLSFLHFFTHFSIFFYWCKPVNQQGIVKQACIQRSSL